MRIKRYFFETSIIALMLLVLLLMLSKMSPTTAVSSMTKYVPPDVIDPKQLLDYPYVQERMEMVRSKREQRGFGMGFQLRSNFWVDNEELDLHKFTADFSDVNVTMYGEGKPETKIQAAKIMSWGIDPIISIGEAKAAAVSYVERLASEYVVIYPEISYDGAQLERYCNFYKESILDKYPELKFAPVLAYEYFSGRLDGEPKWDLIDESCMDFIALTSYPTRIYKSTEELPEDYYQDVVKLFPERDVVFIDLGWSTESASEENQSAFLEYLYAFAKNNPTVKALVYGHLFDPFGDELYYYQGTGLITEDSTKKPAFGTWKKLFDVFEEK